MLAAMPIELGTIEAIHRYPVKSMRGEALEAAVMGWHGLEGDRRLAVRRLEDRGGFPWLTGTKLPELLLFTPQVRDGAQGEPLPTHVVTPEGGPLPVFGEALAGEIGRRLGSPVQMMHLRQGVFDEGSISVITSTTIGEVCRLAGTNPDVRRFRPNVLVRSTREVPFEENDWVGGELRFGDGDAPAVAVTMRDIRCAMVTFDPDTGARTPEVQKVVVRANGNDAGVYATVTRIGRVEVGQRVWLHR
jgi:uncharacterized protein YcbX